MIDEKKLKAKIELGMPLTDREYAWAVLYLNLDPNYGGHNESDHT